LYQIQLTAHVSPENPAVQLQVKPAATVLERAQVPLLAQGFVEHGLLN